MFCVGVVYLFDAKLPINNIVPKSRADAPKEFPGVYTVLHPPSAESTINDTADETGIDRAGFFPVYKSPQRNTCQLVSFHVMCLGSVSFLLRLQDMWMGVL